MTGGAVTQWPCCGHCAPTCPTWGNGHSGPCPSCHPELREPPDEPDEHSSPALLDEPPDDVYLLGHWDGN